MPTGVYTRNPKPIQFASCHPARIHWAHKLCKPCYNHLPERLYKEHHRFLKINYDMPLKEYDDFFNKQNGKCAICKISADECTTLLAVDHDHKTGRVRGLLCKPCNFALGIFKDKIDVLNEAIKYLQ